MKQLLLLLLIVSCTPEGTTVNSENVPSVPCEQKSDIQPCFKPEDHDTQDIQETEIPPEGCNCIKIFRPVCAEGRTFGNSCEAECNGFPSWTPGECK